MWRRLLGRREHRRLAVGVLDAFAGDVEVLLLALYADELQTHSGAGYAGCAAAHEWVEHNPVGLNGL